MVSNVLHLPSDTTFDNLKDRMNDCLIGLQKRHPTVQFIGLDLLYMPDNARGEKFHMITNTIIVTEGADIIPVLADVLLCPHQGNADSADRITTLDNLSHRINATYASMAETNSTFRMVDLKVIPCEDRFYLLVLLQRKSPTSRQLNKALNS